jgi:two-component system, cell cycle sensor histidine kinase and response regulator CckA
MHRSEDAMKSAMLDEVDRTKSADAIRLLVLENAPEDVELALAELKASGCHLQHTVALNREEFLAALQANPFDAILADYALQDWTALDALKAARSLRKDIPFLLVAGKLGEETVVECIKQGVSDYVLKEHLARLPSALRRALEERSLHERNARALEALAESEVRAKEQLAELDTIYSTAPIGLAVYGPDLRYVRVNEHMAHLNGFPAEQHPGLMTRDINLDLSKAIEPYLRRVIARGESILNVEVRGTTRAQHGVLRHWLASFHPLRGANGVINAISVAALEITERKRTEEALARSEARNREIIDNSAYAIFRIARDGTFLAPNPALFRILGCASPDELKPPALVRDVFRYPTDYAECMAACQQKGQLHTAETEWRRLDGALVAVRLRLRALAPSDPVACVEVSAEDVTEMQAMGHQLQHSQKFEAIGQLAGGVAHAFNNVVGAILGWAELGFEQSRNYPHIAERFSRIREQAERAAALTRELLAFARRQVLQPRTVDLNTITSNLVSFLDKVLPADIQLKVVNAPLDSVKADSAQIEQVLMNLCLNARDAMPQGGTLLIETQMADIDDTFCRFYPYVTPGRYAVLCVSDTGMGMDAETRERIFEPFFTTKEHGKSSGMGLATAYGVVRQHGGFIHVYSEPGQGSLFRVYLPEFPSSGSQLEPPARTKTPADALRGTETLLIAEDHDSIREMTRQALAALGYRVLSAADGEAALRLCEKQKPDLAILDLVMPKMGGPETAAKLLERFGKLPVLFTSSYSKDSRSPQTVAPAAHFLQKPYSPSNLARLVREILDQAKKTGGAES